MVQRYYAIVVDGQTMLTRVDRQDGYRNYRHFEALKPDTHIQLILCEDKPGKYTETILVERI